MNFHHEIGEQWDAIRNRSPQETRQTGGHRQTDTVTHTQTDGQKHRQTDTDRQTQIQYSFNK